MRYVMSNTRALFASAGASAALVAAAAVALLAVSAVFAFVGGAGGLRISASRPALILNDSAVSNPGVSLRARRAAAPVVLRSVARRSAASGRSMRTRGTPVTVAAPEARAAVGPTIRRPAAVAAVTTQPVAPQVAEQPRTGDAVRRVGGDVSSTVQKTAATLSSATAPLGPPVSRAVQDVLDRIAALLKR